MSDLIERLRDKARLRAAHGLTGWVLAEEALLAQAADEIERLTAERDACTRMLSNALKRAADVEAEREELRRQLDPMGEYASADELIAAMHAEKAEDEAMKQDAQRYRWLRGREDGRYMTVYAFRTDIDEVCLGDELDAEIDAAMGASNE